MIGAVGALSLLAYWLLVELIRETILGPIDWIKAHAMIALSVVATGLVGTVVEWIVRDLIDRVPGWLA